MLLSDLIEELPEALKTKLNFVDLAVNITDKDHARIVLINTRTNVVIFKRELSHIEKMPIDYSSWLE